MKYNKTVIGNCTIYNGDCLEIMKIIPDKSIDCIITDPPYNIDYVEWDEFLNIEKITKEWFRLLKDDSSIFCFSGWSFVTEVIKKFDNRFILNDWIIYDRIKGRGCKKRLVSTREDLLWYVKSDKYVFNKSIAYSTIKKKTGGMGNKNGQANRALSNVWTDISPIVPWSKERNVHPTQKPEQIIKRIIDVFTNENDLILDCYAGSGTTGKVCNENNRKSILMENKKEYYDLIINRLHEQENKLL